MFVWDGDSLSVVVYTAKWVVLGLYRAVVISDVISVKLACTASGNVCKVSDLCNAYVKGWWESRPMCTCVQTCGRSAACAR